MPNKLILLSNDPILAVPHDALHLHLTTEQKEWIREVEIEGEESTAYFTIMPASEPAALDVPRVCMTVIHKGKTVDKQIFNLKDFYHRDGGIKTYFTCGRHIMVGLGETATVYLNVKVDLTIFNGLELKEMIRSSRIDITPDFHGYVWEIELVGHDVAEID